MLKVSQLVKYVGTQYPTMVGKVGRIDRIDYVAVYKIRFPVPDERVPLFCIESELEVVEE